MEALKASRAIDHRPGKGWHETRCREECSQGRAHHRVALFWGQRRGRQDELQLLQKDRGQGLPHQVFWEVACFDGVSVGNVSLVRSPTVETHSVLLALIEELSCPPWTYALNNSIDKCAPKLGLHVNQRVLSDQI